MGCKEKKVVNFFPRLGIGIQKQKPTEVFQYFCQIFYVDSPRRKGKK